MMFSQQSNWSVMWIIVRLRGYTNCMQHYCLPHTCMHIYCVWGDCTVYKAWWSMSHAGLCYIQSMITWSIQMCRGKAWDLVTCMTSGRHTRCPNAIIHVSHWPIPGILSNAPTSSPWMDITRRGLEILHWEPFLCVWHHILRNHCLINGLPSASDKRLDVAKAWEWG